ncbi:MAG TPA: tail fiber domain-containing protein [Afifellaceae bacterium]|nr:tail fiber domain-containing protein [Afifellaceae bacterium]
MRTGNTPAQRLEQDGSSGFSPQTWDIAGNEANFFVRDVTGGSRLPFRIRPGAPTSSLDIANTGNVGMGTASPQAPLHISEIGPEIVRIQDTDSAGNASSGFIGFYDSAGTRRGFVGDASGALDVLTINSDAGDVQIRTNSFLTGIYLVQTGNVGIGTTAPTAQLHTVGTVRFAGLPSCTAGIVTDGSGNLACSTSSIRFKTVAGDLAPEVALANIMALKPYVGAYKHTPDEPEHWFIAEEVAEVDPALVGFNEGEPYTVKTQNVVADLVAVIQEQQRRLEVQQQTMKRQQRSMQAQLLRIEALEQAVAR